MALSFDRPTWSRFARMFRSFMRSEAGPGARWRFAAIVALLLAINGLNVLNSYVGRDFMTALERRLMSRFFAMAFVYLGVFALLTTAAVLLRYFEERVGLLWREWLTRSELRSYIRPPVLQRLNARLIASGQAPNPAERIADDVRVFTSTTLSFALLLLSGTLTTIAFSGVIWSISPLLFAVSVFYAAAGSALTLLRGRALIRLNVEQFNQEAAFRAELIHARDNAEAIALAGREPLLETRLEKRIDAWAANFRRIVAVNRGLGFFTTGYGYLTQFIPVIVVAPLFIRGEVEFGVVTQSAMSFAHLVGAFSLVVTQIQSISSYAAVVSRLGALGDALEQAKVAGVPPSEVCLHAARTAGCAVCAGKPLPASSIEVREEDERLAYEGLTLLSPADGRVLLRELTLELPRGGRLLVRGSEEARNAFFRASAGVWECGRGRIVRPRRERAVFLQERTYLPAGSLREALGVSTPDERVVAVLKELGLDGLLRAGSWDVERRWEAMVSVEEQQKLAAARALLLEPAYVFLHRATTRLTGEERGRILRRLSETGAALLGDEAEGAGVFEGALEIGEDGGWRWQKPMDPTGAIS